MKNRTITRNVTYSRNEQIIESDCDSLCAQKIKYYHLDDISRELGAFHTIVMSDFDEKLKSEQLSEFSQSEIIQFIQNEMRAYQFHKIKISDTDIDNVSKFCNEQFTEEVQKFTNSGFDLTGLSSTFIGDENFYNKLNIIQFQNYCNEIDENFLSFLTISTSHNDLSRRYFKFIDEELKEFMNKKVENDYLLARIFADVYLSSFNFLVIHYDNANTKGKLWESIKQTVKDAWQVAKPIVVSDAGGAAIGAMAGSLAGGPGIVAGGMAGACTSSLGKAVDVYM